MFKKQIICYLAAIVMTCCFVPAVMAQAQIVSGKVTESPSGDALPGVSVVEINENDRQVSGTVTDEAGNYTLRMTNVKNRIRFSFIGSIPRIENVNGRTVINVSLKSGTELTEIAIRGERIQTPSLGIISTPKRDLISSVTSVKAEVLEREPATSIDQMLQGRAAGVQIVSESGDPGAGADIRIRGVGTLSAGAQPLYIVDGVPITSDPSISSTDVARTNPVADMNPNDIESIDILKDAAAGALYGARAANGVIVITTKRGRPGVTNISFQTQTTLVEPARAIPVLDAFEYKAMRLEAEQNNGTINPLHSNIRPLVDDPTYESYRYYQNNTNWFQGFTQTGITQNYNLSVSGGGEAVRYSFITSYNNDQGPLKGLEFNRFTGRFNLDYKVSNKLSLQANIAFSRSKRQTHWNLNGGNTPIAIALTRTPMLPIYDIDAEGNPQSSYLSLPGFMNGQDNPIAFVNSISNASKSLNLKPNFTATLRITNDLIFRSQAGIEFIGEDGSAFLPPEATGVIWNDPQFNRVQNRDVERRTHNLDNFLTYGKKFTDKFRMTTVLGVNLSGAKGNRFTTEGYATATGQMRSLGAAAGYASLTSGNDDYASIRTFGQAQAFMGEGDKYSAQFTVSREGNSRFGPGNRFGIFPAGGVSWRLSAEPFMKKVTFVNELKLRATVGTAGRQPGGSYPYISQFSTGSAYGDFSGVSQNNPQLDNLKWETNLQKNVAMDLEMFNRRVVVALEFYENHSKDILRNLALPGSSGSSNTTILVNQGDIKSRGIDFDVQYEVIKPKDQKGRGFAWNTSLNLAKNKNIVTKLPGGTIRNNNLSARFSAQVKEGDALGSYYGLVYKGVYARDADAAVKDVNGNIVYELDGVTPRMMRVNTETGLPYKGGDAIYEDFNHDGIINAQDRIKIGNGNPDFFGGFNNTIRYRGISLNAFINFQYGNDLVNGMRYELERMDNQNNQGITVLRRWRKQGDVTNMPRALRDDNRNTEGSTRWIEDGSYLRLRTVTLAYQFPTELVRRVKLRGFDMFVTATNLLTVTNYSGPDPEVFLGADLTGIGVDNARTPRPRKLTLGMNFKF